MKTYGALTLLNGWWVIETTPDVTMRVKRVFPRLQQTAATKLTIKATSEVANDLEWIMVRWPMRMSDADAATLAKFAAEHRDRLAKLESIVRSPPPANQFALAKPLRDYQAVATRLYLEQGHLLDADEVGLGKSATAIASFTDRRTLPALVVVKAHLPKQWSREIRKFIPDAIVHVIKQTAEYQLPIADVYVITYNKLDAWWGHLVGKVRSVVYDEIQELRIRTSKKYQAAEFLNSKLAFRLGLSATPIHNYGDEAWNVINLLAPDALGTHQEFIREWCVAGPGGKFIVQNPDALGHHLRDQKLMVRRTRKEVGRVLPPVIRYVQDVEFDPLVYKAGMGAADELAKIILTGSFTERGQAAREFDLQIRQQTGVAKAPYVAELVRMLLESGEKVILWGWHLMVYDIWKDRLRDYRPVLFTGEQSAVAKERAKADFIEGRSDLLIMSLRSGEGTNGLQDVCSVGVFGEMDWTPAVHHQCIGRLARDGQEASVQIFFPVAPVGSDPVMASILGLKQAQADGIMDLGVSQGAGDVAVDDSRIKQLAVEYLKSRGVPLPAKKSEEIVV